MGRTKTGLIYGLVKAQTLVKSQIKESSRGGLRYGLENAQTVVESRRQEMAQRSNPNDDNWSEMDSTSFDQ
jgi:hypothetical protein